MEIGDWKRLREYHFNSLHYTQAHDWSVKPSEQEMVVEPMFGDGFVRGMLELGKGVYTTGAVLNETCALHVHVEATDFSYWDIRRLLYLYRSLESDIYRFLIAKHRREDPRVTHYCQMLTGHHERCERCVRYQQQYPGRLVEPEPIEITLNRMEKAKSTSDLKMCLLKMLYHIDDPSEDPRALQTRKGGQYEYARYYGMNLHSWLHRGTVEWRMKEATADPMELVMWPLWCAGVVHAVTGMGEAEARRGMGVMEFTERYMPKYLTEWVKEKMG